MNNAKAPILCVRGLHKSFGAVPVLRGIDMDVALGEVVAILGASGSGKSTFLRCINALEDFEAGSVIVDGEPVGYALDAGGVRRRRSERDSERLRTRVGMVFQSYNLFPHLSVLDNVTLGPIHVLQEDRSVAVERAHGLLAKVGLSEKAHAYPANLSGGQQQRVAIARALAMQPLLMLFDEVTSALDPELVGEVLQVMRGLAEDGMTMLVVTHELQFARGVADRVVFFADGIVAEEGPPARVLDHPRDERMQRFIRGFG